MFTGLIQDVGTVTARGDAAGGARLTIATSLEGVAVGDSVACAGCCLTATRISPPSQGAARGGSFTAEVSPETLARTHIGAWTPGTRVNLEPSLRAGDPMGGHFVSGHVDGLATLERVEEEGEFRRLTIAAPQALAPLIAPKGSVALDGISLTVNGADGPRFDVMIIPHTWDHTTLSTTPVGGQMHIEADMLARYAARILESAR